MKQAYCYLSILFILFFVVDTMRADGGDVLERIVRLPKSKGTVYSLLGNVSQQSGYMFIYDSKVIDNDAVVKIKGGERSIRQAVYDIVGDTGLEFQVIGTHILITLPSEKKIHIQQDSISEQPINFSITGTLLDKETGVPISSATVGVRRTSIGSITNQNGDFKLSLPDSLKNDSITFSHIGYLSQDIEFALLIGRHNILSLEPKVVSLQEVVIRRSEPKKLLREMIERREQNYSHTPVYLTTFYREGVQLKNKFQNLSEAVFKVYKTSSHSAMPDQVKLLKMSRLSNVEAKDSLLVKVKSGIQACIQMDIIKDEGKLTLTDHGKELEKRYEEESVLLQKWFGQYLPECSEQDKHDSAQNMVVALTPDFKAKMLEKIADMVQKNSMYDQIDSRGTLEFKDIVEYMVPGDYPVAFVIQKTEQSKDDSPFSMADRGFEHPAVLNVSQDGTGVLTLKPVTIERRNLMEKIFYSGKLMKLEYETKSDVFVPAEGEDGRYEIPADALQYTYHKEERQMVGSVKLKMYAPLANKQLHVRTAALSILMHGFW